MRLGSTCPALGRIAFFAKAYRSSFSMGNCQPRTARLTQPAISSVSQVSSKHGGRPLSTTLRSVQWSASPTARSAVCGRHSSRCPRRTQRSVVGILPGAQEEHNEATRLHRSAFVEPPSRVFALHGGGHTPCSRSSVATTTSQRSTFQTPTCTCQSARSTDNSSPSCSTVRSINVWQCPLDLP